MPPPDLADGLARRLATWACTALLGLVVAQWLGANVQMALIQAGERMWPGYGSELRGEPEPPVAPAPEPTVPASATESAGPVDIAKILNEQMQKEGAAAATEERVRAEERARRYAEALARYDAVVERRTGVIRGYSAVERGLGGLCAAIGDHFRHIFVALLALCGVVATASRHHIALRPIRGRADDRVAQGVALVANAILLASVVAQWLLRRSADTGVQDTLLGVLWGATFAGMAATNLVYLARPAQGATEGGVRTLLCVPLYAWMALLAGAYFVVIEGYTAGLAVYLEKLLQSAQLYLQVGLYVWAGMLVKRTQLVERGLGILRPWCLPPELLAVVLVALAAVPTAYSGASGIFVIAAGGLIYRELRKAGARPGLALASTAMSGSLGVVLSPCLLVMIIAYLDGNVTSDELYGWGRWIFLLTAGLFTIVALVTRTGPLRAQPGPHAFRASARALWSLWPYVIVFAGLLVASGLAFGVGLDPQSAPVLIPLALLLALAIERRADEASTARPLFSATNEATVHIGALLLLMGLSACLGGAVERTDVVGAMPVFDSPWSAMPALVVVLVLVGMVMDPYGAAILVYATLARLAQESGIAPAHFWMVVLVAFELGYLTPPVALNHLLTRQVVDEEPAVVRSGSFWRRHESYLLPITVMWIALLVVAFGPLLLYGE